MNSLEYYSVQSCSPHCKQGPLTPLLLEIRCCNSRLSVDQFDSLIDVLSSCKRNVIRINSQKQRTPNDIDWTKTALTVNLILIDSFFCPGASRQSNFNF